ncbi:hypothetical protein BU23DRAFT_89784 [Bimuria novae-zelandiae CBS 107.79]|uniref:Cora-domain-containing protein n=1 Tax=Bimuria novae-zelandiae CBS 107.79 TaxID=1447943 RepID=A0A6A5VCB3_9PLEO|nr:hypothetical protein BU23DRAFT_89784 [Bimuria novae-zelandiae CBS 107.79]
MDETLDVIDDVFGDQLFTLRALKQVLNSKSYRITTHARISAFQRFEEKLMKKTITHLHRSRAEIHEIQAQIDRTAESLRYNLEIAEEGQSKAILVFTLVTIIFLPLSFVANVFGMNTADIRDTEKSQGVFCAVALPLTAAIGAISLLVAYGNVGDRFTAYKEALQKRQALKQLHAGSAKKRTRRRDEEEV